MGILSSVRRTLSVVQCRLKRRRSGACSHYWCRESHRERELRIADVPPRQGFRAREANGGGMENEPISTAVPPASPAPFTAVPRKPRLIRQGKECRSKTAEAVPARRPAHPRRSQGAVLRTLRRNPHQEHGNALELPAVGERPRGPAGGYQMVGRAGAVPVRGFGGACGKCFAWRAFTWLLTGI